MNSLFYVSFTLFAAILDFSEPTCAYLDRTNIATRIYIHNVVVNENAIISAAGEVCKNETEVNIIHSKIQESDPQMNISLQDVQRVFCLMSEDLKSFNDMLRTRYRYDIEDPLLYRNMTVFDMACLYKTDPDAFRAAQRKAIADLRHGGKVGRFVSVTANHEIWIRVHIAVCDARVELGDDEVPGTHDHPTTADPITEAL